MSSVGARLYRMLHPQRERDSVELRMAAKCAAAHAENLERTVSRIINGHGGHYVGKSEILARKAG